ncbi:ABC transporter permease [Pedobacter antarcticus 4BY]|uniref:ABC transporter permease n=2 Tax=Pedobacter antarcticus TaxID=34086 RepID=A0A081PHY1_9SPHI|nr:ABC transporter permease [Pedobacter antarcticus]KEQ30304.1 ABC transporter permease [Pedobacter antarcticus 4BY]SFE32458.1 ABC-type transport system, involved in lipoprotein release, permease component [Pedobacter antarcticus]
MFRLNLKIAWRHLWKNKTYTLINITGLSIGIAGCMLLFVFLNYQLSFDKGHKNGDRIYRFVTHWNYSGTEDYSKGIPLPLVQAVKDEISGLDKVTPVIGRGGIIYIKDESGKIVLKTRESVYYTDPEFFEIFDLPFNAGNQKLALSEPNTVILSENMAKKFYGSTDNAMGKSFLFGKINLLVTGVFKDIPKNSSLPLEIVISYETFNSKKFINWDGVNSAMECYVLLKKGLTPADLEAPIARFNKNHYQNQQILGNQENKLQSLADIHFNDKYGSFAESSITRKEIYGLSLIGLFLILTACINFINLATAQAVNRSKEVGVRKVMGSERKQLVIQFLTETFSITLIALLIACVITELSLPAMENLFKGKVELSLFSDPIIFLFMAVLVITISFLAGFYPAVVISNFNPVLAIKNKISINSNGLNLRKVLVIFQFSISIILIIGTLVIMKQMKYLREKPLGFNPDAVALVNLPSDSLSQLKYSSFKERLLKITGIENVSFCQGAPLSNDITTSDFSYDGKKNQDFELRNSKADENYIELFGLKLIAGKVFKKSDTINGCVVNETFLKKMNISDPEQAIGKELITNGYKMPITGVVKDYNDLSLQQNISPIAIYPQKGEYYTAAIKMNSLELMQSMKDIESLWNENYPNSIYNVNLLNDEMQNYYENERITGMIFNISTMVILSISFIGLFGLISFVAVQRTKEVAIRKVLGASTTELVNMLNSSFMTMVLIANVLAWPLAYLFVSHWLSGFAYRIQLNIWPFCFASLISVLITLLTISIKSYQTAKGNPVRALKYE